MPTTLELERLDAIVNRLLPLSSVQRGELIHAAAWNTVVEALIEVARAVLAEARPDEVPEHEHLDQVTMSWLDASLRTLIQRGPLADPVTEGRLRETERRAKRFDAQYGELQNDLKAMRQRLDEVITRDLAREATVIRFDRRLQDLPNTREEVLNLRGTLDTLRKDVQSVVTLSDNLEVDGEPIDMTALVRRLETVEALRESLITSEGQLLDASQFEIKLQQLSNEFVGRDELDEILSDRRTEIPQEQLDALRTDITDAVNEFQQARLERALSAFQNAVDTDINHRLSNVDELVAGTVSNLEGTLRSALLEALRPEINGQIGTGIEAVRGEFATRIVNLEESLAGLDVSQVMQTVEQVKALEANLGTLRNQLEVVQRTTGVLEERLAGIDKAVSTFSGRMGTLEEAVSSVGSRMSGLEETVKSFDGRVSELEGRVRTVDTRLTTVQDVNQDYGRRLSGLESTTAGFNNRVGGLESRLTGLEGRINTTVTDVSRLTTTVTTLTSSTASLERNLTTFSTRVSGLENNMGDIGGRVKTLERGRIG